MLIIVGDKMSVDFYEDYVLKGKSEDLARFVENHIQNGLFNPHSLDIEYYPEPLHYKNPHDPQVILDRGITEIRLRLLIVIRMHFDNQHIKDDILSAMQRQYPELEITSHYMDLLPDCVIEYYNEKD